jgi:hypothetical protein
VPFWRRSDTAVPVHPDLVRELGLPAADEAEGMALALASDLWNEDRS